MGDFLYDLGMAGLLIWTAMLVTCIHSRQKNER